MIYALLGGTGTLGHAITRRLLNEDATIRILARGEHRLSEMREHFHNHHRLSFLIGDVRDQERIRRALKGVDRVILMAALKHVNSCEYNVLEAVDTNITGAANVVRACADAGVSQAVLVSSDKAVEPITNYGATKMVAERIFIYGNSYTPNSTKFHVVRYGNVLASQGSIVERWRYQSQMGKITITDPDITRFWWTANDAARFVLESFKYANRGDVIVPLMSACSLGDLADIVAPYASRTYVSRYSVEKTHETMLSEAEADKATYVDSLGAIRIASLEDPQGEPMWGGRRYSSDMACTPYAMKEIQGFVDSL